MKKKAENQGKALAQLREELQQGVFRPLYIFHGEEDYMLNYYLKDLQERVLPSGAETFNFHQFEGKNMDIFALEEAVECFPMMAERSFVLITDWDVYKLPEEQRKKMLSMLEDLPEYCSIVIHYDLLEFHPDGRTKMAGVLEKAAMIVEFPLQEERVLLPWIQNKEFPALGKQISPETAREFLFYCGNSMTKLKSEMGKVAAYALGEEVTFADVEAVATPHLNAIVFQMTDAIGAKDFDLAIKILGDLFQMQEKGNTRKREKELGILGAMSRQLRHLYMAKLATEARRSEGQVSSLLGVQSFVAGRMMSSARRFSLDWCREAVVLCGEADRRLKSAGVEGEALLTQLLLDLALSSEEGAWKSYG